MSCLIFSPCNSHLHCFDFVIDFQVKRVEVADKTFPDEGDFRGFEPGLALYEALVQN